MAERSEQTPPTGVMARVVARSMFLQASLNSTGMQNIGRLFALVPIARWLGIEREQWRAFAVRHLGVFNSNPFVATIGIGALARIEADAAREGTEPPAAMIERFSMRLSAPLGSVGDELYWTSVRPKTGLLAVLLSVLVSPVVGAAVFIGGFAIWQVWSRVRGFGWGWHLGPKVGEALRDVRLRRPASVAATVGAVLAGMVVVAIAMVALPRIAEGCNSVGVCVVFGCAAVFGIIWASRPRSVSVIVVAGVLMGIAGSLVVKLTE